VPYSETWSYELAASREGGQSFDHRLTSERTFATVGGSHGMSPFMYPLNSARATGEVPFSSWMISVTRLVSWSSGTTSVISPIRSATSG